MPDRDQQLVEAAMRYLALLRSDQPVGIDAFVATVDPQLRGELSDYLHDVVAIGLPPAPRPVSAHDQAMAETVAARVRERNLQRMQGARMQRLTDLRKARKLSIGALARQLNLPPDLLARIERGGVIAASVPPTLVTRLAELLAQTDVQMRAALAAPPAPASTRLSATDGTVVEQEPVVSFADALAASAATPAQRDAWRGVE